MSARDEILSALMRVGYDGQGAIRLLDRAEAEATTRLGLTCGQRGSRTGAAPYDLACCKTPGHVEAGDPWHDLVKAAEKGTREGELTRTRDAVRTLLTGRPDGDLPEWRTCYSTDLSGEPTGIAPACPDEGHEATDGGVYACCVDPVVEVESHAVGAYLVALLNTDRQGGGRS